MPDMSRWKEEDVNKALQSLKERDKLFGWDKIDYDLMKHRTFQDGF